MYVCVCNHSTGRNSYPIPIPIIPIRQVGQVELQVMFEDGLCRSDRETKRAP